MYQFMHYLNCGVLVCHVIGLTDHLICKVHIGVSEVSHCHPVFCSSLHEVSEGFIDSHQVVGSVDALPRGLLPLSEVGICLYGVGLEGCLSPSSPVSLQGNVLYRQPVCRRCGLAGYPKLAS